MTTKSWTAFHTQALKQSLGFFKQQPIASVLTVGVIALTLILSSLFWLLSDQLSQSSVEWQKSGHISLYMKGSTSSADEANLLKRIRETPGVGEAILKTPSQGLADLQMQEEMQDIMRYLPENPLPAVIEVIPATSINTPDSLEALHQTLKAYPFIEETKLDLEWMKQVFTMLHFISTMMRILMMMLGLAVVLIIGNTLRLIIQDKQDDITVFKLVGAGDAYIMRPFLYAGVWYGLFAAILAVGCVDVFVFSLNLKIGQLFEAYQLHYSLSGMSVSKTIGLMTLSSSLGWIGARLSVKRHCMASLALS